MIRGVYVKRFGISKVVGYLRVDVFLFLLYFERKFLCFISVYVIIYLKRNGSYVKGFVCGEVCFLVRIWF